MLAETIRLFHSLLYLGTFMIMFSKRPENVDVVAGESMKLFVDFELLRASKG